MRRFVGPFKAIKRSGDAYTLDIPSAMKLHLTFYVGRLKPYHSVDDPSDSSVPSHSGHASASDARMRRESEQTLERDWRVSPGASPPDCGFSAPHRAETARRFPALGRDEERHQDAIQGSAPETASTADRSGALNALVRHLWSIPRRKIAGSWTKLLPSTIASCSSSGSGRGVKVNARLCVCHDITESAGWAIRLLTEPAHSLLADVPDVVRQYESGLLQP